MVKDALAVLAVTLLLTAGLGAVLQEKDQQDHQLHVGDMKQLVFANDVSGQFEVCVQSDLPQNPEAGEPMCIQLKALRLQLRANRKAD